VFSLWGYEPIETPTLELMQTFTFAGYSGETAFKLFDADGELLVMRPDVTLPIARMVGSRIGLRNDNTALRLRYAQSVYREESTMQSMARSFTQAGVECIGTQGAEVDAEVLLIMAEALEAAGVSEYTIAFCTVAVLRELLAACVSAEIVDRQWELAVLSAWHKSDLVTIDQLMASIDSQIGDTIRNLARLQGAEEAISTCMLLIENLSTSGVLGSADLDSCTDSLQSLQQTLLLVSQLKPETDWLVDFSVMSSFDYYTGLICAAYAPGSGYPLASGGRYDSTMKKFGSPAPAAGFALNLERVMATLLLSATGGELNQDTGQTEVVTFGSEDPVTVFLRAESLRAKGHRVALGGRASQPVGSKATTLSTSAATTTAAPPNAAMTSPLAPTTQATSTSDLAAAPPAYTTPATPTPDLTAAPPTAPAPITPTASIFQPTIAPLRMAIAKGELYDDTVALLAKAGLDTEKLLDPGRQLVITAGSIQYYILRPSDVPVFTAHGGVDCAICGKDSLVEANLDIVELADLRFGACRFVVAEQADSRKQIEQRFQRSGVLRIASKYPYITNQYYEKLGLQIELIKMHGNIELAPLVGMADRIVDITATGRTLKENNLVIVDEIMTSTARFIANPSSARVDPRVRELAAILAQTA